MRTKKTASIFFLVLMLVLNTTLIQKTESQLPDNTIFIDPPSVEDETNSLLTLTINITISYVEQLWSWEVKIRFNPVLLYTNKSLIEKGPFFNVDNLYSSVETDYLMVGNLFTIYDWVDGGGVLATVTFIIRGKGETLLNLYDTKLLNPEPAPNNTIEHTSQDGYFRNVDAGQIPTASFTHSPTHPLWYENVTFDASTSLDPDGSITRYLWFFGDKNLTTGKEELGANETDPIAYHKYLHTVTENEWNFTVRLMVIDNDGITGNLTVKELTVVSSRALHDIAIIRPFTVDPTRVDPGGNVSIVIIVENQGNSSETFNATVYYDSVVIDTQTDIYLNASYTMPLYFTWNTTGIEIGVYAIKASVSQVIDETDTADNTLILGNVTVTFAPAVSFTYDPTDPYVDDTVTFNASASRDPDGNITRYLWDFGDDAQKLYIDANLTDTTTHVYVAGDTYIVALTLADDLGATNTTSKALTVSKFSSVLSLQTSPVATVDQDTEINGSISPVLSAVNVTILYRVYGENSWNVLANTTTNTESAFSYTWSPSAPGSYELKAKWDGDEKYNGDESDVTMVVAKFSSSIYLSADPSSVIVGEHVTVNGSISPPRSAAVVILYKQDEGSWNLLLNTTTDQNGQYTLDWKPLAAGTYEIKAKSESDENYHGAESNVTQVTVTDQEPDGILNNLWYFAVAAVVAVIAVLLFGFLKVRKRQSKPKTP